ncbi:MAG: hypothetical protein AB8G23_16745 [Myxococcota bacterium]
MKRTPRSGAGGIGPVLPREIVPSVECAALSPARVAAEFRALLDSGARFHVAGTAKRNPERILARGYTPKHRLELFGTRIYLSNVRQNPELRFYVAFVVPPCSLRQRPQVYARIFYKDLSLVWRAASHLSYDYDGSLWIGKGDVRTLVEDGEEMLESIESTTDLPLEIQSALEEKLKAIRRVPSDPKILEEVLRRSPPEQIEPFADFTGPRTRAASNPRNRIHGGRSIARFIRAGDPTSLKFVPGFEPDFRKGLLETSSTKSRLYGGMLKRFRILSKNQQIQYVFIAGPDQVWIIPPQATTTELSTYGVRTIDVTADDDIFLSGWEYHYLDTDLDPPEMYSQIPKGFAGRQCPADDQKADASPWLDQMPVVKEFRRLVLGRTGKRRR